MEGDPQGEEASVRIKKYEPQMPPRVRQLEALDAMAGKAAFALHMAMRTGKTYCLLTDFGRLELNDCVDDLAVIGPAAVLPPWLLEIDKHLSRDLLSRVRVHHWRASQSKEERRDLVKFTAERSRPRVLLMGVEALSSVTRARDLIKDFLSQRRSTAAIDEATVIKNPDSKRTEFILKLRGLARYRRTMSGLPTPNSPLDIFSQFYFLDPQILGHWTFTTFRARYAEVFNLCVLPNPLLIAKLKRALRGEKVVMEGIGECDAEDLSRDHILQELKERGVWVQTVPIIKKFKNEKELSGLMAPHVYRATLADCYDLPPKEYLPIRTVELTKEQGRVYEELKRNATAELESEDWVTANMVIVRLLRLHQVLCGHTKDDEGKIHDLPENRSAAVMQALEEYDGKAIIWFSYDRNLQRMTAMLRREYGEESVARFWGGNMSTREAEEERFVKDPRCRFMLATPAAGGRGRTWTVANLLIYFSNTNNLEHRDQSEERGQGVGKEDRVAYLDFVSTELERKILKSLRAKIDMATIINNDSWREWVV
jgi:SNF2 family DNA or RNA helicase